MTLGIVVIGRNEAAHLSQCLAALPKNVAIVYADSGSSDGSARIAGQTGVEVVSLTAPPVLTAARGRNAGLARLRAVAPATDLVQMVDGDTFLDAGWLMTARAAIEADPRLAAVFGQLRERHPEASLYNRLCNREWQVPPGKVSACGGIALFRVAAIESAGGYSEDVVAGEEPDLCLRMRAQGWAIEALAAPMGTHDAGLLHFGQWWGRARRAGHAYAEHVSRHGPDADAAWVRSVWSIIAWGGALPVVAITALLTAPPLAIVPVIVWGAQVVRIAKREPVDGAAIATMTMVAKFPQLLGVVDFHLKRWRSRQAIAKMRGPSTR